MAIVAAEMKFRVLFGTVGSYAPTYEDVSRRGIDGHRFKLIGKKGRITNITGRQFYTTKALAELAKIAFENQQGTEVRLIEENPLEFSNRQVFVFNVTIEEPKAVGGHTDPALQWMLDVQLEVMRTL